MLTVNSHNPYSKGAVTMVKNLFSLTPLATTIAAVSGEETFIKSGEFAYITPSFMNNYRGGVKEETSETRMLGIELLAPATFRQMFEPLASDITKLAFTENQIVDFIRQERKWMTRGGTTYFLFKYNNGICVAAIFPSSLSFGVDIYTIDNKASWNHPQFKNCVVIPRRR